MRFDKIFGSVLTIILVSQLSYAAKKEANKDKRKPAASQATTIPFNHFKGQFEMKSGQTYLSFMMKTIKPALDGFKEEIDNQAKQHPNQYSLWQTNLIAGKHGVAIRINKDNYIFNVGYLDGSDPLNDVKSGRSYGVGP